MVVVLTGLILAATAAADSLPGELFPLLLREEELPLALLLPCPFPLELLLPLLLPLLFPFTFGLLPATDDVDVDDGAAPSEGDTGLAAEAAAAAARAFFWCFFMQNVEQKFGFGAFARITLSHWTQAPLLYAFRNSRMHVSEQNSFLPFCVGRTYLRGVLASPHQMQVAVLLVAEPPLPVPADVAAEVSLRGVRPPEPEPEEPLRRWSGCCWLLATSAPLLLVMLLLLLLPGDELPAADITHCESRQSVPCHRPVLRRRTPKTVKNS